MANWIVGCQISVTAAFMLTTSGLPAPHAFSQTRLTGNDAVVAITARATLENYKATLKALSDMGTRQMIDSMPTESNDTAVAWLVRELGAMGYATTVYGTYRSVYCTKVGALSPDSMYILCAHLDGVGGFSGNCDDDASGTALVVEAARAFADPAIATRYSIRFFLTNGHEAGYRGAIEYRDKRRDLQGKENPPGSRQYPEPVWLGLINQDLILYDHGNPAGPVQIPGASIRVNYCGWAFADKSLYLAQQFVAIDKVISVGYPAVIPAGGGGLGAFDAGQFANYCPTISPEEGGGGAGYIANPLHHDDADSYETYSEADFALAFSATQREVGLVARITEATVATGGTSAGPVLRVQSPQSTVAIGAVRADREGLVISTNARAACAVTVLSLDGARILHGTGCGPGVCRLNPGPGVFVVTVEANARRLRTTVVIAK